MPRRLSIKPARPADRYAAPRERIAEVFSPATPGLRYADGEGLTVPTAYPINDTPGALAIRTGEFRPPRKGELYLSGAIVEAWRAPNDLSTAYLIARPLPVSTTTPPARTRRRYINRYGQGYRETVSECTGTRAQARAELTEYQISDPSARYWLSSRCCNNWKD